MQIVFEIDIDMGLKYAKSMLS